MRIYTKEEIIKIIGDVKDSENLISRNPERLCTSAQELVEKLTDLKKYIIPEKREEWCDLINGLMYDVRLNVPPIMSSNPNLISRIAKSNLEHDEKLANEILMYVYVGRIMEACEEKGLDESIALYKELEIPEWARVDIVYDILRFSKIGIEFINAVYPELIKKPKFKREYDKALDYLKRKNDLEDRLTHAIKVKTTLEEYKEYCVNYYYWECDNTVEKLNERKTKLARLGEDYLKTIVNNTYIFAEYLLQYLKEKDQTFNDHIFTSLPYQEDDTISLGCTGGHFADQLYKVECYGKMIWISEHILNIILNGLSMEEDYDTEDHFEDNIGCTYEYPKLSFSMKLDDFNKYFTEFFENRTRRIEL